MADAIQPDTELLTLPVLPLPNGVVLPGMVLTIALESDEAKADALVVRAHERALLRTGVAGTGTVLWLQAEPVHPEVTDEARVLASELV